MKQYLEAVSINQISKDEYLNECDRGLEIMAISTCGSGNLMDPDHEDIMMVSMCKPGEDEPHVSYTKLRNDYLFTRGWPWISTSLHKYQVSTAAD